MVAVFRPPDFSFEPLAQLTAAWRPPPRPISSLLLDDVFRSVASPRKPWPHSRRKLWLCSYCNIDSTVSAVGWALLPVKDSDGQECPSYKQSGLGSMKFQVREYTVSPIQTTTNSPGNRLHSFFECGTNQPGLALRSGTSGLRSRLRSSALALRRIQAFSPNRTVRL